MKDTLNLGKINPNEQRNKVPKHIPSKVHPDTLFTFMPKLEYLLNCLQYKMVSPRYCEEDIGYLKIKGVKSLAYPMKCFATLTYRNLICIWIGMVTTGLHFVKNGGWITISNQYIT